MLGLLRLGVLGDGDALDDAQDRPGDRADPLKGAHHRGLAVGNRGVGGAAHVEAQQFAGRVRVQREQHDAVGVRAGRLLQAPREEPLRLALDVAAHAD